MKPKLSKLSVLAALAVAGGAMATTQAEVINAEVYDVNFSLQNATPICAVYGLPQIDLAAGSVQVLDYSVETDGKGKITGFAELQLTSEGGTSTVMANITGTMGMKGNAPVVKMTIKGPGYGNTGTAAGKASIKVKFNGSPVYVENGESYTYEMQGKANGTFNSGLPGANTVQIKNAEGTLSGNDTGGTTQINSCILSLVAVNNKLALGGCLESDDGSLYYHEEWSGRGNVNANNGKFSFTLTGTGPAAGSSITVKGDSAPDNPTPSATDVSLTSMKATGKMMGQKVNAEGDGYLTPQNYLD